ncbi:methionyl-tRNA synthetase [Pseudopedobacter saltans DSM 12145]|uniref:Methionine--tRNA ligase n=1 Tax=Pseudopedobacter saltans (strain ATCC 51119 / DSM 12145 / JCM 21818 / CCUG 39354 / LMG 10337 / NBRC 100064 / NCIMB 13643) TaxID=762903 RepID=F0SAR1_PSESL|nr:methionine--tRNA ligase [Pseudopedobacter saltans]ADY53682.1 methionyl-tRNA synthetase [Pseudopedobacter saltans DSM 12145]
MDQSNIKRYTITAALPYANGPKHIGHLAGAYIPADLYVRYLRLKERDVVFVCGSDEHGTAIANQAMKENTTPRAIIDKYHTLIEECFSKLGISFDIYHRTSEPIHHETAQDFFRVLDNKDIFKVESSEQYYDEEAHAFLADRYIKGTCPNCGDHNAYGDQCEKCGTSLSPDELINPISTLTGNKPVKKMTKHWYLPLNEYEGFLKEWILEGHKSDWKTNVYGQCKSWIDGGLHPRAVTRDLDWGIKVPAQDAEGKVLYVWFDAPIGYISATKQWAIDNNKDWEVYWKDKETKLVHFIGKDNIVFHCIVFPVMLKTHGEFILPDNVPANEFMNLEGDKMSTSRGWSIEMHEYLEDFPTRIDELRYYLASIAPETSDSEFTWKDYQARVNNELVAILGNFVNRVMILMQKYFAGKIESDGKMELKDAAISADIKSLYSEVEQSFEAYKFRQALASAMDIARLGNKYLTEKEPWKSYKEGPEEAREVLHNCLHIIAHAAICLQPFLPNTAKKMFNMLNLKDEYKFGEEVVFEAGHQLNQATLLFEKVEDDVIAKQIQKLIDKKETIEKAKSQDVEVTPAKENITFDQFSAMDIRTGVILEAEKVAKTKKLLKLKVDTGIDIRTVVSGIAEHYQPEDIIGQQVSILVNLEPREIKGIQSQGMILMAENAEGKLCFVAPIDKFNAGSVVR